MLAAAILLVCVAAAVVADVSRDTGSVASRAAWLTSPARERALLRVADAQTAERERWLALPAQRAQRSDSVMRYDGLDAARAIAVTERTYGSVIAQASATPAAAVARAGRVLRYEGPDRAVVQSAHGRLLEVSSVPLWTNGAHGVQRPVDLSLRRSGSTFAPANPLAPVEIAVRSGAGVALGNSGVRLTVEGRSVPGRVRGDGSVVFASVAPDEDAVVVPTIHGAELFAVLRSALSPTAIRYRVTLPPGATLRMVGDDAVVARGSQVLATVNAPVARDAQGSSVSVRLATAGHQLVLTVPHRSLSVAYPLLVDPTVDIVTVDSGWTFTLQDPSPYLAPAPGTIEAPAGTYVGPNLVGGSNLTSAQWDWRPPPGTPAATYTSAQIMGLTWNPPSATSFAASWGLIENASQGTGVGNVLSSDEPVVDQTVTQTFNPPQTWSPSTGESFFQDVIANPYAPVVYSGPTGSISVSSILLTASMAYQTGGTTSTRTIFSSTATNPGPSSTTTTTTTTTAGANPVDYVALGDSYSSGEGNPPFEAGTDDILNGTDNLFNDDYCHRSIAAYPNSLAPFTGLPLSFYACSGDQTINIPLGGQGRYTEPPQLDHSEISGNTALVTLTIGGNDVGFAPDLSRCIKQDVVGTAENAATGGAAGADPSCADDQGFYTDVNNKIQSLENDTTPCATQPLCSTFQAITSRAPKASVIVADYPIIFPTDPAAQTCSGLAHILTPTDQNFFDSEEGLVDAEEQQAAAMAGVNFVDVRPYFAGHAVCDTGGAWLNGLSLASGAGGGILPVVGSFHPNALGHSLGYADAIENFITSAVNSGAPTNFDGLPANPAASGGSNGGSGGGGGGGADPPQTWERWPLSRWPHRPAPPVRARYRPASKSSCRDRDTSQGRRSQSLSPRPGLLAQHTANGYQTPWRR